MKSDRLAKNLPSSPGGWAAEMLITACGLGYAPVASGTFGTLGGVALAGLLGVLVPAWYLPAVLGLAAGLCVAGAPLGDWAERRFGRKDPGPYVLDEVAGYLVAAAWFEFPGWTHLIAAFFAFRLFDVLKPWPARKLEKVPGGWGILLDDIAAGAWALAVLSVLRMAFPHWLAS